MSRATSELVEILTFKLIFAFFVEQEDFLTLTPFFFDNDFLQVLGLVALLTMLMQRTLSNCPSIQLTGLYSTYLKHKCVL